MLKIDNDYNGYMVKATHPGAGPGSGWRQKCKDLAEVHHCLDHYFGGPAHHAHHSDAPVEGCPLCRDAAKR